MSVNCPEPEECCICNWNGDWDVEGLLSFSSGPDHFITVLIEGIAEEIAVDRIGFEARLSKQSLRIVRRCAVHLQRTLICEIGALAGFCDRLIPDDDGHTPCGWVNRSSKGNANERAGARMEHFA